jgi:CheY-like chemotaxis protein
MSDDHVTSWCDQALDSARHMTEILDNVLDEAKLEQGKLVLEQKPLDFQLLCSDVFKMLMHTKHDGVEMRLEIPKGLFVLGDAVRWRQLLINLLSNATKFTRTGWVGLSVRAVGEGLSIEICDTGDGIAPELIPTLFDKYTQGGFHKGSGLGLSIARMIVELFHSQIEVESPWDKSGASGTRFSFVAPQQLFFYKDDGAGAGAGRPATPAAAAPVENEQLRKNQIGLALDQLGIPPGGPVPIESLRILIVDDETLNCMIMSTKMKQVCSQFCADLACESVHSGEAAVAKFHEFQSSEHPPAAFFDLIIMDEHMGDLKGSEATRLLRQAGCEAVIVAASGNCLPANQQLYRDAGADHCWPKPYPSIPSIARDIQEWLSPKISRGARRSAVSTGVGR